MTILGLERALQQMAEFGQGAVAGLRQGMRDEADAALTKAKARTPVGKGDAAGKLRDSGHIEEHTDGYEIVFDAVDAAGTPYAVKVHEDLSAQHDDGQAKYLSSAVDEQQSGMDDRIGRHVIEQGKSRAGIT
jgi:hypothetical protein